MQEEYVKIIDQPWTHQIHFFFKLAVRPRGPPGLKREYLKERVEFKGILCITDIQVKIRSGERLGKWKWCPRRRSWCDRLDKSSLQRRTRMILYLDDTQMIRGWYLDDTRMILGWYFTWKASPPNDTGMIPGWYLDILPGRLPLRIAHRFFIFSSSSGVISGFFFIWVGYHFDMTQVLLWYVSTQTWYLSNLFHQLIFKHSGNLPDENSEIASILVP